MRALSRILISVILLKLFLISQETTVQNWLTPEQVKRVPILWQDKSRGDHYELHLGTMLVYDTPIFASYLLHDWSDEGRLLYHWFTSRGVTVNSSLRPGWIAVQVHKAYGEKLLQKGAN